MQLLDSLWPWRGAFAALVAAILWAGLLRLLGRRDLATLGAGAGLAVGWAVVLGLPAGLASPRQLPERLPLLALAALAVALLLALAARGRVWVAVVVGVLAVLGAAWWLAGAPPTTADLRRNALVLLALTALGAALLLELRSPLRAAGALALLLAGFWIAAPPAGPWMALGVAGLAAALGGLLGGPAWGTAAALPVALDLAGLLAGPVLARGATVDWTTAAAPVAALWGGPALAARIGGRFAEALGWLLAGGVPLLFTFLLARGL